MLLPPFKVFGSVKQNGDKPDTYGHFSIKLFTQIMLHIYIWYIIHRENIETTNVKKETTVKNVIK